MKNLLEIYKELGGDETLISFETVMETEQALKRDLGDNVSYALDVSYEQDTGTYALEHQIFYEGRTARSPSDVQRGMWSLRTVHDIALTRVRDLKFVVEDDSIGFTSQKRIGQEDTDGLEREVQAYKDIIEAHQGYERHRHERERLRAEMRELKRDR